MRLALVAIASPPRLRRLELAEWRVFRVLEPCLSALEVLEVNLGHLNAAVAHEPREAVELAPALEPGPRERMAELVWRHGDLSDPSGERHPMDELVDTCRRERLA